MNENTIFIQPDSSIVKRKLKEITETDAETRAGENLLAVELDAAQTRLATAKNAIKNGHRGLAYSSVQLTIRNLENLLDII